MLKCIIIIVPYVLTLCQAFCETLCIILLKSCTNTMRYDNCFCFNDDKTAVLKDEAIWSRSHSGIETKGFLMPLLSNVLKAGRRVCICLER